MRFDDVADLFELIDLELPKLGESKYMYRKGGMDHQRIGSDDAQIHGFDGDPLTSWKH